MNEPIISYQNLENFNFYDYSNYSNYNFKNYYNCLKHYIKFGKDNNIFKKDYDYRLNNDMNLTQNYIHWQCNNIDDLFKNYNQNKEIDGMYCFDNNILKKKLNNFDLNSNLDLKDIKYLISDIIIEKSKNIGVIVKYFNTKVKNKLNLNLFYNIYIFKFNYKNNNENIFVYKLSNSLNNTIQLELNNFKKYYNSNLFIPVENSNPNEVINFFNQTLYKKKLNIGIIVKYFSPSVIKNIRELKNIYNIFIFKVNTIVKLELIDNIKEKIFIYRSPNCINDIYDLEINNFKKYYNINFFITFENLKLNFKKLILCGFIKAF